jgi:hypothetical protein
MSSKVCGGGPPKPSSLRQKANAGMGGWRRSADRTSLRCNSLPTGNFTGKFVILGSDTGLLNRENAAPQLLLRSFPPPSNREILRGNRELSRDNREFHAVLPPDAIRQETPSLGSTTLPTRRQAAFTGALQAKCCANFRRISASARCPLCPEDRKSPCTDTMSVWCQKRPSHTGP